MDTFMGDDPREQRFAVKIAGFNLLFLFLGVVLVASAYAVFQMMNMFILAMIWAVLIGTMMFPIKYCLRQKFTGWLRQLDDTDTPFIIGLVKLPYDYFNSLSEWMFKFMWSINGLYALVVFLVLKLLNYENTLSGILIVVGHLYSYADSILLFLNHNSWLFPLVILYVLAYGAWLFMQNPDTIHKKVARFFSLPIWIYVLAYLSEFSGPFRVFIFTGAASLLLLISAGIIDPADDIQESDSGYATANTFQTADATLTTDMTTQDSEDPTQETEETSTLSDRSAKTIDNNSIFEAVPATIKSPEQSLKEGHMPHPISSDVHMQIIGALVIAMWMIKHETFFVFFLLPLCFAALKRGFYYFGVVEVVGNYFAASWQSASPQIQKIFTIVAAGPLRKFLKLLFTSDRFMVSTLKAKADVLATAFVMALLAFGSLFAIFFVGFELHSETVHLVRIGSGVVANNRDWFKFAMNYTEDQFREHNIDDYVEQAYQHGRAWLASNVRSLADPKDTRRADELEQQAEILVDQLYRLWEDRNAHFNNTNSTSVVLKDSGGILSHLTDITNLTAFQSEITNIIKNNIETVLSIVQSLWSVIIVNISVLNTIVFTILGFVFGFGFDMINLFIEVIVFLTMIFYLLTYSKERWLPLDGIEKVASFLNQGRKRVDDKARASITFAVEDAIKGVFVLSAKMSLFYGLYTYFVHSLFNLNIVFIPSLLAALFAAIPIIPAYSVLIFGAIELYFVRQEAVATLVFAILSVAPVGFADRAFYSEVKSSHPYVTGLAIIGGMYWLGLQGAIFGPIILCSTIAFFNLYVQLSA